MGQSAAPVPSLLPWSRTLVLDVPGSRMFSRAAATLIRDSTTLVLDVPGSSLRATRVCLSDTYLLTYLLLGYTFGNASPRTYTAGPNETQLWFIDSGWDYLITRVRPANRSSADADADADPLMRATRL